MIKLTKYQETELRKFIEDTGNKYKVNVHPLYHSGYLSGLGIGKTHNHYDYILFFDSSLSKKYYSLDPSSEIYYMAFNKPSTFDRIKNGIEQTIFELAAYDYLINHLKKHKLQHQVYVNNHGQIDSCEVYLPDDTTREFFIWFSDYDSCRCDVVGDLDFKEYMIEAHDINATKKLIRTYVKELMGAKNF